MGFGIFGILVNLPKLKDGEAVALGILGWAILKEEEGIFGILKLTAEDFELSPLVDLGELMLIDGIFIAGIELLMLFMEPT